MATPNVFRDYEEEGYRDGFRWRGTSVGLAAGGERLGATVYELPPGEAVCPYHYHLANEELLIVLRGRPHLRTPTGWRELEEGEVVAFPVGEHGAHQVVNRASEPAVVVIASEMRDPEVAVYPDSDKVGVREHAPGSGREGMRLNFRMDEGLDYWQGEEPPEVPT
jgi:uncharacterized cupin superfamily protein